MKITHILHSFRGGGIQNFILSLASEQSNIGDDISVIVIDKYDSDYCRHIESLLKGNKVSVYPLNRIVGSKLSLIRTILLCCKLIKKINPDIINSHSEFGHLYASLATFFSIKNHVITIHNAPEKWSSLLRILCNNRPLIFCSQAAYDKRVQNSCMMTAIDNGISKNIITSNKIIDLKKEYSLNKDDKVILLVGSLRPQKNYIFLKKIVESMGERKYHFFICGGGISKECENDIKKLKEIKNIHFIGLRDDISALENGADLFLSCSTFEGLPIAVLEAYFNGIPCVLSPIDQHRRISDVECVWIPKDFTPASFIESIDEALSIKDTHNNIYKRREKQISYYSINRTVEEYKSFYKKVLLKD